MLSGLDPLPPPPTNEVQGSFLAEATGEAAEI